MSKYCKKQCRLNRECGEPQKSASRAEVIIHFLQRKAEGNDRRRSNYIKVTQILEGMSGVLF